MVVKFVADIGGTNSRFAIADAGSNQLSEIHFFKNKEFSDFEPVFEMAIEKIGKTPNELTIAVAGPVKDNAAKLTNRGWQISATSLRKVSPNCRVNLINDFTSLAHSLPHLTNNGLHEVRNGVLNSQGHKLVIGPGTGLGVGYLINASTKWVSAPGEGGHVSLPVQSESEFALLEPLKQIWKEINQKPLNRVSAERVLSGPGLACLYNAIRLLAGNKPMKVSPETIVKLHGEGDAAALEAVSLFTRFLGRVASDLCLSLIPSGGLYIGGGLSPAIFKIAGTDEFMQEFTAKGRVSAAIENVPVHVILEPYAGLIGSAAYQA